MKLVIRYYPIASRHALGEIYNVQFMALPVTFDVLSRRLYIKFLRVWIDITEELQDRA